MSESDPKGPPKDAKPREKTSGRVAFDSRGNAVWEWKMQTGVFGRDVDTGKLRTLEAPDLEIADDPAVAPPHEQQEAAAKAAKRTGFDPYNSNAPKKPAAISRPATQPDEDMEEAEKTQKPGFFKRLFNKG